jgi:hypothetical protein
VRQITKTLEQFELRWIVTKDIVILLAKMKKKKRICKYCGWDMDESNIEILIFFHSDCWKEYRKDGLLYPMPEHV